MTKQEWKRYWRQIRIFKREYAKAATDMICFGSCLIEVGEHVPDLVRYVPLDEWVAV